MTFSDEREHICIGSRRGTGCAKWDGLGEKFSREDLMAVWVADMDFRAPAHARQVVSAAAEHGAFGYGFPPRAMYDAFISWQRERHGYEVERLWIRLCTGVVNSLYRLIPSLTEPGDAVIVQTPVYYPFMSAVKDTGRRLITNPLLCEDGRYSMDFADLERKARESRARLLILCSPHNPVGRVWSAHELRQVYDICAERDMYVISDEIHQDIIPGDKRQLPAATVFPDRSRLITLTSASKTFNLAGLNHSFEIVESDALRRQLDLRERSLPSMEPSPLSSAAVAAAYAHGAEWLETVTAAIRENLALFTDLGERFPELTVYPLEGTYLLWIDLGGLVPPEETERFAEEECGFAPDYGSWFMENSSMPDSHIRINLAAPAENLRFVADAMARALAARRGA